MIPGERTKFHAPGFSPQGCRSIFERLPQDFDHVPEPSAGAHLHAVSHEEGSAAPLRESVWRRDSKRSKRRILLKKRCGWSPEPGRTSCGSISRRSRVSNRRLSAWARTLSRVRSSAVAHDGQCGLAEGRTAVTRARISRRKDYGLLDSHFELPTLPGQPCLRQGLRACFLANPFRIFLLCI